MIKEKDALVRDKVPAMLRAKGKVCTLATITDPTQFKNALITRAKFMLGTLEKTNDHEQCIECIADIYEIMITLAKDEGLSITDLNNVRIDLGKEYGKFGHHTQVECIRDIGDTKILI